MSEEQKELYPVDLVRLYFGDDCKISDNIIIHQPSIQEIVDYGENEFWSFVTMFCSNPTSMRLMLWNNGIDWNKITEFQLFQMLLPVFTPQSTSILFGDLDFTKFRGFEIKKEETDEEGNPLTEVVLINIENPSIIITEEIYYKIINQLRSMFDYHPKVERARDKFTKEMLIEDDQLQIRNAKRMKAIKPTYDSFLLPLLSFALNHPGFKYKKDELRNVKFFEFMDSIKRLQEIESTIALLHGMYFGMVNFKENPSLKKDLNLLKELY